MNRKLLSLPKPTTLEVFVKKLMAVPKSELDEEAAEYERKKKSRRPPCSRSTNG